MSGGNPFLISRNASPARHRTHEPILEKKPAQRMKGTKSIHRRKVPNLYTDDMRQIHTQDESVGTYSQPAGHKSTGKGGVSMWVTFHIGLRSRYRDMTSIFSRSRSLSLSAQLQCGSSSQADINATTVWRDSALMYFSICKASVVALERQMSSAA